MSKLYESLAARIKEALPECRVEDLFWETDEKALRMEMAQTCNTKAAGQYQWSYEILYIYTHIYIYMYCFVYIYISLQYMKCLYIHLFSIFAELCCRAQGRGLEPVLHVYIYIYR